MRDVLHLHQRQRDWLYIATGAPLRRSQVLEAVIGASGVSRGALLGASREAAVARPRMLAAYLMRHHCTPQPSTSQVGRALGDRDHSTVLHALRRWPELRRKHPDLVDLENAARDRLMLVREVA